MKNLLTLIALLVTTLASSQTEDAVYFKHFADADGTRYVHIVSDENYDESTACSGYFRNFSGVGDPGYDKATRVSPTSVRLEEGSFSPITIEVAAGRVSGISANINHVFQIREVNGISVPYGVMHDASAFDLTCDQ